MKLLDTQKILVGAKLSNTEKAILEELSEKGLENKTQPKMLGLSKFNCIDAIIKTVVNIIAYDLFF